MTSPVPKISTSAPRTPQWPAIALVILFLVWAVPLWATNFSRGKGAFDQHYYHAKAIARFAIQLGAPPQRFADQLSPGERASLSHGLDFSDYESATTPAYHVLFGLIAKHLTSAELPLQILASIFTILLLWLLARTLTDAAQRSGRSALDAFVLSLPLACSTYVLLPGIWLQPDNAAWLGVLVVLVLSLRIAASDPHTSVLPSLVLASVCLLALVWIRQSHAWTGGLLVAACYLKASPRTDGLLTPLTRAPARALGLTALALIATIPAAMTVLYFFRLWSGPVPPMFQKQIGGGPNLATPAFCLSLIGVYSVFLCGWTWSPIARLWKQSPLAVVLIAAAAVVVAAIPDTTFLYEPRATGLWNLVKLLDKYSLNIAGHTTPLFLLLAPIGAIALAALTCSIRGPKRWVLLAAVVGMTIAQTANPLCWQRYVEPLFLIVLPLMALLASRPMDEIDPAVPCSRWLPSLRTLGPAALAAALALLTLQSLVGGESLRWSRNSDIEHPN